jgi:cation:H+ antiporter
MSDGLLALGFVLAAGLSLGASWLLVVMLERVGARLALAEALLGMLAALAADAPEITTAVTALVEGNQRIGAGVVIGSNVFNLAALIGLSGVIAGYVALHRRVIELGGGVALWIAAVTLAVILRACSPVAGLALVLAVMVPYTLALAIGGDRVVRLRAPRAWTRWLQAAIAEEELELEVAIHPRRGGSRDAALAAAAVVVVVAASVAMEASASKLGSRHAVSPILVGALVLAAVTSLPNAVAGVYLAARGRGAAALSTSFNSNAINVLAGLLIPTSVLGLGAPSDASVLVAASYVAMTVLVIVTSYIGEGLRRGAGFAILAAYAAFTIALVATA